MVSAIQSLPRLQYQPPGAAFAVLVGFLLLEHPDGLAGEVGRLDVGSVSFRV